MNYPHISLLNIIGAENKQSILHLLLLWQPICYVNNDLVKFIHKIMPSQYYMYYVIHLPRYACL